MAFKYTRNGRSVTKEEFFFSGHNLSDNLEHWRNNRMNINCTDEQENFKSMADGKRYTSKKKYRESLKDHGYIEVGPDRQKPKNLEPNQNEIAQSIKETMDGRYT